MSKSLHMVTFILLVIGGLNWLLVGVMQMNLVEMLLGGISDMLVRAVYVLVGLSAIVEVIMHKSVCRLCGGGDGTL